MTNVKYRSRKSCVYSLTYHVVFCTKFRKKLLKSEMNLVIQKNLSTLERDMMFKVLEWNIDSDHIHLLISNTIEHPILEVVGRIKGKLSFELRKNFPHLKAESRTLWSRGKFIATTGGVTLEHLKKYVQNQ